MGEQFAPGEMLGHYCIAEKIGEGGMREVYRARDDHLDCDVAVKVLPLSSVADESARSRFRKEARALARLNHPNIAVVHDYDTQEGVDYLVMEYIPGTTLNEKLAKGRLPEKEVLAPGMQLAEGLSAAHEHGVVHRDLKPSNLRLTSDGRLKILDFGLAKLRLPVTATATTESFSEKLSVAGTLPYMAPEQLLGGEVDARTDVHAAGYVLYEMATGQRPFTEVESSQLIAAILSRAPLPASAIYPALSAELVRIIGKCLEKESANRYQSARELAIDLKRLQTGISPASRAAKAHSKSINSLAVLPLKNATGLEETEYFSDGVTESIIGSLSQLPGMRVMALSTVLRYHGKDIDPQTAGRELNVRAVIAGRLLKRGDFVSLGMELVDVADGAQLWSGSYNRRMADIFAMQNEIATEISNKLSLRLSSKDRKRLLKRHTQNAEAYQLYQKGRFYWARHTQESVRRSLDYFQHAIQRDPSYALAYVGAADAYLSAMFFNTIVPAVALPQARAAVARALELDDCLAEAHATLANIRSFYDWDADTGEREFRRSIELNPNYSTALLNYGVHLVTLGRTQEAENTVKRALEIDPFSLIANTILGFVLMVARRYQAAAEQLLKTLEMDPNYPEAHFYLASAYWFLGKTELAIKQLEKGIRLCDGDVRLRCGLAALKASIGCREEALSELEQLLKLAEQQYLSPFFLSKIYFCLGEDDKAYGMLEKALQQRDRLLRSMKVWPFFDPMQSDPRFQELLRRVRLA